MIIPKITVSFDQETYKILQKIAPIGQKASTLRAALRFYSFIKDKINDGYSLAFLKEGKDPTIIDFL